MKKITPRISKTTEEFMKSFKTMNAGAEYCLDSLYPVSKKFLGLDIKGKFSGPELKLMIDVMNGTMLTPQFAGQHIPISVSDGIELDHLNEKWEVDGEKLKEKLAELSTPELFFLEIWIQGFWELKEIVELDEYINQI